MWCPLSTSLSLEKDTQTMTLSLGLQVAVQGISGWCLYFNLGPPHAPQMSIFFKSLSTKGIINSIFSPNDRIKMNSFSAKTGLLVSPG